MRVSWIEYIDQHQLSYWRTVVWSEISKILKSHCTNDLYVRTFYITWLSLQLKHNMQNEQIPQHLLASVSNGNRPLVCDAIGTSTITHTAAKGRCLHSSDFTAYRETFKPLSLKCNDFFSWVDKDQTLTCQNQLISQNRSMRNRSSYSSTEQSRQVYNAYVLWVTVTCWVTRNMTLLLGYISKRMNAFWANSTRVWFVVLTWLLNLS